MRLTLKLFCRKITFSDPSVLYNKGPLLLACNHPNSFLDAIIIGSHFRQPVHFLARGDAFRKPFARKILSALKMIPIYRLSEGREHLALNDATFERCRQILLNGGIVLIFAEGLCVHQWLLRPLKKGAARIAIDAWDHPGITGHFRVYPVSLNYNSFNLFGKRIIIHFGKAISGKDIPENSTQGEGINYFNQLLTERLQAGMIQSTGDEQFIQFLISNLSTNLIDSLKSKKEFAAQNHLQKEIIKLKSPYLIATGRIALTLNLMGVTLLAVPAIFGWIIHIPLYYPLRKFVKEKTAGTVFYDSVLFGSLLLTYPFYWLLVNLFSLIITENNYIQYMFGLMPFFAWIYLVWRDDLQRVINTISLPANPRKIFYGLLS